MSPVDNAAPARLPGAAQRIKGQGGRLRVLQEFKIQSLVCCFFFFATQSKKVEKGPNPLPTTSLPRATEGGTCACAPE